MAIRGGGESDDSDNSTSDVSHTNSLDMYDSGDYSGMEAEYAADQTIRDQEQKEEEEEMEGRASTFPADNEAEPVVFQPENVQASLDIDDDEVVH